MPYADTYPNAGPPEAAEDPPKKQDASDPGMITNAPANHPSRQTMPAPEEIRRLTPNAPPTYAPTLAIPRWQPGRSDNTAAPTDQSSQQDEFRIASGRTCRHTRNPSGRFFRSWADNASGDCPQPLRLPTRWTPAECSRTGWVYGCAITPPLANPTSPTSPARAFAAQRPQGRPVPLAPSVL
jgi:hypothetical protein